ncbi:MAG: DUF3052 domain-containing protein [Gemmatimonadota bacterium]
MAGYSGTSLARKLGIAGQERLAILSAPRDYLEVVGFAGQQFKLVSRLGRSEEYVHLFARRSTDLRVMDRIAAALVDTGMVWISWPKKNSGVATDLTEAMVRQAGLKAGLVDVKVCAVDEVWSGLKFVRRLRDRAVSR